MDEKSISLLVLLDMSKAFDSLNHNILLSRLRRLGLTSHYLSWFASYLSDWKQRERCGDAVSQTFPLTHSFRQGSILGPVLFTIYIDGLILSVIVLKIKVADVDNAIASVNADLQQICKWCVKDSLLLNPDKTKLLVIGLRQLITILDKIISPVPFARDSGVPIDERLPYDTHITKTVSFCFNQYISTYK